MTEAGAVVQGPRRRFCAYFVALVALVPSALAQATVAAPTQLIETSELSAGGLHIMHQNAISVEREDVTIAADRVRVTYVFRNIDTKPRILPVAFALPDIDMAALDGAQVSLPAFDVNNPTNFVGFWSVVDGTPIQPEVEQRALAMGLFDVSTTLTELDVPVFPLAGDMSARLAAIPRPAKEELAQRGIISLTDGTAEPLWTLKTAFVWRVTFPSVQSVTVSHGYQPVGGRTTWTTDNARDLTARYCVDKAVAEQLTKRAQAGQPATISTVIYTSQGAWQRGTVAAYRLAIERSTDKTVVSSCRAGLKPQGARILEVFATDFVADEDISILFAD